jgi:hypothetical protein
MILHASFLSSTEHPDKLLPLLRRVIIRNSCNNLDCFRGHGLVHLHSMIMLNIILALSWIHAEEGTFRLFEFFFYLNNLIYFCIEEEVNLSKLIFRHVYDPFQVGGRIGRLQLTRFTTSSLKS